MATYNIEDLRTTDFLEPDHPRLRAAARTIQRLRPDVLLINEIAYDQEGVLGYEPGDGPGFNPERFVRRYLSEPQDSGLTAIAYRVLSVTPNTGIPSGFDLDNSGEAVTDFPRPEVSGPQGSPPRQTESQRAYGNDAWGFGTFPGQYSMALFVTERVRILRDQVRSFRELRWSDMPGAMQPMDPATGEPWYSPAEWAEMRLSSKNHVDVPVRLANGFVIHLLLSHPTPPAFDGPEQRNKKRNHDEIRFWIDYIEGASYIVDDEGVSGGLPAGASFAIMGDLNADPDEGSSLENPIGKLLEHSRVNDNFVPVASEGRREALPELDPDDTAVWGLRVDYVLPSIDIEVLSGGVWRPVSDAERASDHFPVYVDILVPAPERAVSR